MQEAHNDAVQRDRTGCGLTPAGEEMVSLAGRLDSASPRSRPPMARSSYIRESLTFGSGRERSFAARPAMSAPSVARRRLEGADRETKLLCREGVPGREAEPCREGG